MLTLLELDKRMKNFILFYYKVKHEDLFLITNRAGLKKLKESILLLYYFIISIFILLARTKATEALTYRVSNYPNLLSEMPRYCCPLEI